MARGGWNPSASGSPFVLQVPHAEPRVVPGLISGCSTTKRMGMLFAVKFLEESFFLHFL